MDFRLPEAAIAFMVVIGGAVAWKLLNSLRSPMANLPGPWHTIISDLRLRYEVARGRGPHWIHQLHLQYGPAVRLGPSEASFQDPAAAQIIHRIKGEYLKADLYDKLITGVVNVFTTRNLDVHKRQRRLLSSEMAESALQKHVPVVESNIRLALNRMRDDMEKNDYTDVYHWFLSMATDIIGELSFGESFRMLETGEENQYIKDMQSVAQAGGVRVTFPFLLQLSKLVNIPVISDAVANQERLIGYADQSIKRHQKLAQDKGDEMNSTLFSKLYDQVSGGNLSFIEVRDNAVGYIVAGSDTTASATFQEFDECQQLTIMKANSLTYLVWLLCRHPEVRDILVAELRSLPSNFNYEQVKSLEYLGYVIEETLRLYPAAPAVRKLGACIVTPEYSRIRSNLTPDDGNMQRRQ
ncbi:Cytochrome P450 monooxygenase azaI [Colletotrichum siamense]|uniref:Cytochrome P450 monooxygenase azaI n=1 Tax=Colletotrichum siamense TaxID=690259 RepID=A0A9P5K7P9_COLSI|nr:Cytochrome P450 monooxygenase azaI [Colletotrichum siamense]KAF4861241.1 Cytochrome P450 monooxygenase azaI [Colletotrichum siamense]